MKNKLNQAGDEIWAIGQKHKLSYDDWNVIMGRIHLNLAKNFIEPVYQVVYGDGGKKNYVFKARVERK